MKTPISYYGGKTNMLRHILPMIPGEYRTYVEPFFGGGAVFFGKEPSKVEVINDTLDIAVNFYLVVQNQYTELEPLIKSTLHSEAQYSESKGIIKGDIPCTDPVKLAWAFWAQTRLTFSNGICKGFAFAKDNLARTTANKIDEFSAEISRRLRHTQIFRRDALDVIRRFDREDTFFYLDPPYANSDCGHYNKGKDVFYDLLKLLPDLKGRWLLSSYPCAELDVLRKHNGVYCQNFEKSLAVSGKTNAGKRKIECLTWNYNQ